MYQTQALNLRSSWEAQRPTSELSEAQCELVNSCRPLAIKIAKSFFQTNQWAELDDLVGAAILSLTSAAKRFDAGRGAKFSTYAWTTIVHAVLQEIGRQRSEGFSSCAQGIADTRLAFEMPNLVDQAEVIDVVDRRADAIEEIDRRDELDRVMAAAETLSPEQEAVIRLSAQGKTQKQIAEELGRRPGSIGWLKREAIRKLRIALKIASVIVLLSMPLPACAQQITLPKEVKGEPGDWITVTAETDGKTVRWVPISSALKVFPSHLLKDTKTAIVSATKPGRYRLLAYTAKGDEPSEPAIVVVVVESDAPTPPSPPGPSPPGPPPGPPDQDPFTAKIRAALATDAGTPADKTKYAAALSGFYAAMAKHVDTNQVATVADLLADYRAAIPSVLPEGSIPATRKLCGQEVAAMIGDDPERKIDKPLKDKLVVLFNRLAKSLDEAK